MLGYAGAGVRPHILNNKGKLHIYIRRTRFDDFDDWIDSIDWRKAKSRAGRIFFRVINAYIRFVEKIGEIVGNSAMFMWIMMAALAFAAVFDGLGAVRALEGLFMNDLDLSPWQILLMMQISFIILGIFLDDTAMLVIVAPLYIPLVVKLGFDPIWFGVLYTITCQIAYITPPFGYNLFLITEIQYPHPIVRARPRHECDRGDGKGRAGGLGISIARRN